MIVVSCPDAVDVEERATAPRLAVERQVVNHLFVFVFALRRPRQSEALNVRFNASRCMVPPNLFLLVLHPPDNGRSVLGAAQCAYLSGMNCQRRRSKKGYAC